MQNYHYRNIIGSAAGGAMDCQPMPPAGMAALQMLCGLTPISTPRHRKIPMICGNKSEDFGNARAGITKKLQKSLSK